MSRSLLACVLIVGLCAVPAAAQQTELTSPSVTTEGRASQKVEPDQAFVTVTAETRAVKTTDAQAQNATAIAAVRAALKKIGLADDAVKTRSYSVEPQMQYNNGKSTVIGSIARHSLDVRVDDLTKLGAVIDAAGAAGGTSVSDVRYDVKGRDSIESRLLSQAVADGMRRAEAMAAGAGRQVLTIWRIDEQRNSMSPQPMYRQVAMAAPAPPPTEISPNEIEIQVRVTLTVLLK